LTILLAEDDADLRAMLAIVLRRAGHRVLEFRNGGELLGHLGIEFHVGHPAPADRLTISEVSRPPARGILPREAKCLAWEAT
jgi:hypothetical protein